MTSRDELVDQVNRLVDQLRSTSLNRLERVSPGQPSLAQSAHALAQVLADLAADLRGTPRRDVPHLAPLASGDLVAVTAYDLVAATRDSADFFSDNHGDPSDGIDRPPVHVVVDVALAAVKDVRAMI